MNIVVNIKETSLKTFYGLLYYFRKNWLEQLQCCIMFLIIQHLFSGERLLKVYVMMHFFKVTFTKNVVFL